MLHTAIRCQHIVHFKHILTRPCDSGVVYLKGKTFQRQHWSCKPSPIFKMDLNTFSFENQDGPLKALEYSSVRFLSSLNKSQNSQMRFQNSHLWKMIYLKIPLQSYFLRNTLVGFLPCSSIRTSQLHGTICARKKGFVENDLNFWYFAWYFLLF